MRVQLHRAAASRRPAVEIASAAPMAKCRIIMHRPTLAAAVIIMHKVLSIAGMACMLYVVTIMRDISIIIGGIVSNIMALYRAL